jgi:Nif-specific regulatory protein
MPATSVRPADHTNEIRRLATLLEVSQALSGGISLKAVLHSLCELLERRHQVAGATVTLLDDTTRELHVEATGGIRLGTTRARDRSAETITRRVLDSGRAVVVPQVSQEPALAQNMGSRRELTFVAVPIVVARKPAGTLEVVLTYRRDRDYERSLEFYKVVASMIAQAVKVRRLVEADRHRLTEENEHLRDELRDRYAFRNIIGNSASIQQVYEQVAQVARTNTTVLIRGESGTGKEMIAHAIHYNSPRAKKAFVKVSCAALPESLIESELFGYERGAFTGAMALKKGRFELADGGTLFLDEIGDLSPSTQVKLLRVLQEREIERLGGTSSVKVNVRLIAATHRPLEELIAEGTFRQDLYYRLAVFSIFAPPLRERKPDIMLLADHFLERYSREHAKHIRRIATPAIDMLTSYHWPGNVRELGNTIERAVLVCDGGVIHAHHLPPTLQTGETSDTIPRQSLTDSVSAFERDLLQDALKTTRGNCAKAARLLDTTERVFNYKVKKYRVDVKRFRG